MHRLSSWIASTVTRSLTWVVMATALGAFACTGPMANAASVVVEIFGTFGPDIGYGAQPAPLNGGSFSGTVTFPSQPGPDQTVVSATADVNFYDSTSQLLFTVGGSGSYNQFMAGPSSYEFLTVTGGTSVGSTPVSVSGLSLSFNNWLFGSSPGMVQPYGGGSPADYDSYISYTYGTGVSAITYYSSVVSGQASVPEPSTLALGLAGLVGVLVYARCNRHPAGSRPVAAP